jgi:hypothetical protein
MRWATYNRLTGVLAARLLGKINPKANERVRNKSNRTTTKGKWHGFVVQVSGPTDSNPGGVVAQGRFGRRPRRSPIVFVSGEDPVLPAPFFHQCQAADYRLRR